VPWENSVVCWPDLQRFGSRRPPRRRSGIVIRTWQGGIPSTPT
jgi:hypothetical protein